MSLDQRLCPGVGGHNCGAFMSPIFRDPHPCSWCRGRKCSSDVTYDICQWEAFLKKRSYSGHRKSHPTGSTLPPAPLPNPPAASASSKTRRRSSSPRPSSLPSEGSGRAEKSEGVSRVGSCGVSPPPSPSLRQERGEGGGGSWLLGASVTWLLPPSWGWG